MLRIALCDDEAYELELLSGIILEYARNKNLKITVEPFQNEKELLLCPQNFDVIFLDIQMGDANGIEVAKSIRERDKQVKIIYVTNFSNYQVDAFSVRAFGYVVKPIAYDTIAGQLDDVITYTASEEDAAAFTFNTNAGIKTLNVNDIYYFESSNHKIQIVTKERTYLISDSIPNILNSLRSHGFSMPHKSFVINLLYVSNIKGYDVLLTSGDIIPISQKRAVEFKAEFHTFLRNNFNLLTKR